MTPSMHRSNFNLLKVEGKFKCCCVVTVVSYLTIWTRNIIRDSNKSYLNLALLANFMKQRRGLGDKVGRGVVSTFITSSITISFFWAQILDKTAKDEV